MGTTSAPDTLLRFGSPRLRRASLAELGFISYQLPTRDQKLLNVVEDARSRMGAQFGAIDILTPSERLRIVGSAGVDVGSADLRASVSNEVFRPMDDADIFYTPDINREPALREFVRDLGLVERVGFYAAAPLVAEGGVFMGALCLWSEQSRAMAAEDIEVLHAAAQDVMEIFTGKNIPASGADNAAQSADGSMSRTSDVWDIDKIIDQQAIRTVFQPIVHLETQEIVGFEALSRGPEGSALESPMALLEAANNAGRLGELDWLCRVQAVERAADSGLAPSLAWFVNVEPAGLAITCPEHLRPAWARAREQIRLVLEIVEREADVNVVRIVRASEQARFNTWGVALDDVGAEPISLALLPVLQPDVIKLDMSLLHGADPRAAAKIVTAINAYAEKHGAVVLAEGVESSEHEELAKAFGAQYGQGYKYGRPGDLPESLPTPRNVVRLTQHLEPVNDTNPWELLAAARPSSHAPMSAVQAIGDVLEQLALKASEPGLVLICAGDAKRITQEVRDRHHGLVGASALTVVLGKGVIPNARRGYQAVLLPPHSELARYQAVIVLSVDDAGVLIMRECQERHVHQPDCVEYIYTLERDLVVAASRALINAMEHEPAQDMFDLRDGVEGPPTGEKPDASGPTPSTPHRWLQRRTRK